MSDDSIQKFLDMIIELIQSNPSLMITDRLIYAQLVSFNLGKNVIPFQNIEMYFRNWITYFNNNPLIDVYRDKKNPYICHFNSKRDITANIKVYIPLDADHIKDGVINLFDFLSKEGIDHRSKVLSSIRNDNIIVRVSKIEDANKIIKYVKNNAYLSSGLLNINPFLIPCFKLGVIIDNNYTYNIEVSQILASILGKLDERKELYKCTTSYIDNLFTKLSIKCLDDELSNLYKLASIALDENSTLQDFANYAIEYNNSGIYKNKHGNTLASSDSSVDYFNFAIKETFKRYNNLSFVINAVKLYVTNGDVKGFTRINQARKNLELYANRNDLLKLFEKDNLDLSIKYYILRIITEEK